jgi:2-polyprenyl-3-methyl-5-hydroxy-6-metoxy-1,4-benzoquinol methylase
MEELPRHRAVTGASGVSKRTSRETNPSALRPGMLRLIKRRIVGKGEIDFPCIPALLDTYLEQLTRLWDALGKPFSSDEMTSLRAHLERGLAVGYEASTHARIVVEYQTQPMPKPGITYAIRLRETTVDEHYAQWITDREPPIFGKLADAKVMALAEESGDPRSAPVLDVGAGTGRNSVPLALRGHPVDALEAVPEMADEIRKACREKGVTVDVTIGDVASADLVLKRAHYRLIVLSEVISDFRDVDQVRRAFVKFEEALLPGGLVVASVFLAMEGYKPDAAARQISRTAWSSIFTRSDLAFIADELAFDRISDESVCEYEREHLPPDEWPPTKWYADWTQGRNVFAEPAGKTPVEMRWLVYRRR